MKLFVGYVIPEGFTAEFGKKKTSKMNNGNSLKSINKMIKYLNSF
jgi:hypothetical protein